MNKQINLQQVQKYYQQGYLKSVNNLDKRDSEMVKLLQTMEDLGYDKDEINEVIDKKMEIMDILKFHKDLLVMNKDECTCCIQMLDNEIKALMGD